MLYNARAHELVDMISNNILRRRIWSRAKLAALTWVWWARALVQFQLVNLMKIYQLNWYARLLLDKWIAAPTVLSEQTKTFTERKSGHINRKEEYPFLKCKNENFPFNREPESNAERLIQCHHILIQIHLERGGVGGHRENGRNPSTRSTRREFRNSILESETSAPERGLNGGAALLGVSIGTQEHGALETPAIQEVQRIHLR